MNYENSKIDLICQHCMDGSIIPIKFRVQDEDGVLQECHIKGYKDTSEAGMLSFDCNTIVNNMTKKVKIYTSQISNDGIWRVKY